jgi:hypothetical protein
VGDPSLPGSIGEQEATHVDNVERWMRHSAMSDIGRHEAADLPADIGALNAVVQGIIIHTDWLAAYGVNASDFAQVSRDTLPVADRLGLVFEG